MKSAYVVRVNVPMVITFDDDEVEYVVTHLAEAIDRGYKVYAMFTNKDDDMDDEGY